MFNLFKRSAPVKPILVKVEDIDLDETVTMTAHGPSKSSLPACTSGSTVYSGVKTFWRARLTMEIMILDHQDHDCLEVVSYAPKCDTEGSRIYVSRSGVLSKLSVEEIEKLAKTEKENCLRAKKSFQWDQLVQNTQSQLMIRFILSRLSLQTGEEGKLVMYLSQSYADKVDSITGLLDVVCEKPEGLTPYVIMHHKVATLDEIQQALNDVDEGTKDVGNSFASVHNFVTSARSALGLKKNRNNSISFLSRYQRNRVSRRGFVDHSADTIQSILQSVREMVSSVPDMKKTTTKKITKPKHDHHSHVHFTDLSLERDNTMETSTSNTPREILLVSREESKASLLSRQQSHPSLGATSSKKRPKLKKQPSLKKQHSLRRQHSKHKEFPQLKVREVDDESMNLSVSLSKQLSKRSTHHIVN